ncbi:MAG TPA: thiamine pyrophosphate-dependent enzyme, partial [Gemmatimonadaceae bacterium]|nr:thiamine pyrophosphate-dependent enzyme [Gemmatimonadaceae bacterium]
RYQQEVNLLSLFTDVSLFNQAITGGTHVVGLTDAACRAALSSRGVAHITCSVDTQEQELGSDKRSKKNIEGHTSDIFMRPITHAPDAQIRQAAEVLLTGERTAILAGQGALGAGDLLEEIADILAAPIVKPLLGKGVVPDDSPFTTGGIGLLGTLPSELALEECDTLLIAGSSFPYMDFYPEPGKARAVQIDRDPTRIGLRYPVEIGLTGDTKATLERLREFLVRRADRSFLEKAQTRVKDWNALMRERESLDDVPMKPEVVAGALNALLRDDAIISTDSGTITTWIARHLVLRRGQQFSCSGNLATMAPGLPYAIAAQIAYPDRQCVAFVGDGAFTMLMGEFATAVKYGLPITVVIIKNNTLGMIKWEQMVFLGNPEYGVELQPIDFVKFAEACGGVAFRCERPDEVRGALEAALSSNKPAIVEAIVDPFEPPMPARITREQALNMTKALMRGEPHRGRIALTLFRDKVRELI